MKCYDLTLNSSTPEEAMIKTQTKEKVIREYLLIMNIKNLPKL